MVLPLVLSLSKCHYAAKIKICYSIVFGAGKPDRPMSNVVFYTPIDHIDD